MTIETPKFSIFAVSDNVREAYKLEARRHECDLAAASEETRLSLLMSVECSMLAEAWINIGNGYNGAVINIPLEVSFLNIIQIGYNSNIRAGWWTDLETGFTPKHRNPAELAGLVMSEIVEAQDCGPYTYDDKLPQYFSRQVEIIDALVRLADIVGYLHSTEVAAVHAGSLFHHELLSLQEVPATTFDDIHRVWGQYFEVVRRAKQPYVRQACQLAAYLVSLFLDEGGTPRQLGEIYASKWMFNMGRKDHKIENRLLDDGKKI